MSGLPDHLKADGAGAFMCTGCKRMGRTGSVGDITSHLHCWRRPTDQPPKPSRAPSTRNREALEAPEHTDDVGVHPVCTSLSEDHARSLDRLIRTAPKLCDDKALDEVRRMELLAELADGAIPQWLTFEACAEYFELEAPMRIVQRQVAEFAELEVITDLDVATGLRVPIWPFRIDWFTFARPVRDSSGRYIVAKGGAIGNKERQRWRGPGRSPGWCLELSLPYWLAAPAERDRVVHTALMMCDMRKNQDGERRPVTRGFDVLAFHATIARFGANREEATLIERGLQSPLTAHRMAAWGFTKWSAPPQPPPKVQKRPDSGPGRLPYPDPDAAEVQDG